jgi:hypothetical protein
MPPDFVAGGMEHPMANFITPGVITGVRPQLPQPSTLIAHELAHSWSGDSTTLATWNDVWLNEGITSYLTVRFIEALAGADAANLLWWTDRRNYSGYLSSAPPPDTILHREVPYPGYGFSTTSYTKGELFIKTLEDRIGRDEFDRFIWRYFRTFAYRWVDDTTFIAFLRADALSGKPELEQSLQLEQWLYQPGLPSNLTAPTTSVLDERAKQRAAAFSAGTPLSQLAPATWTPTDITLFLQYAVLGSRIAEVDAGLGLSGHPAPPTAWLTASIRANYAPGIAAAERLAARPGPRSRLITIYRTLNETSAGRTRALALFAQHRAVYDLTTENAIAAILGLQPVAGSIAEAA